MNSLITDEDSFLNTLTVLDPAVGSGAFLVFAMKELISTDKQWDQIEPHLPRQKKEQKEAVS